MQVWRLQTNTDGGDVVGYCIKNNVVAMGWGLDGKEREILRQTPTFDKYCELADGHYKGYSSVKRMISDNEGFRYPNPSISLNEKDFWNLLQPDDAEDLLCMWLYHEKGYIVIPSTNKKGTELYECVLIDPKAEDYKHIYVQVKKGNVEINATDYEELKGEVYFLTTEGTVINVNKPNYIVVSPKTIFDFAINPLNKALIPEGIANWIKFLRLQK